MIVEVGSQKQPQRYSIKKSDGTIVKGIKSDAFPRGNPEEYPTFELEEGTLYGCHVSRATPIKETYEFEEETNQNGDQV